jgi:prepilin signal peptidase PulO-like enzyme (type II secretory pathway)
MDIFFLLFSGFLGAAIGSFLNVVLYRYGTGSIHKGRSICLSCGGKLHLRDLVPIFSYVFLGGKCRSCKMKISPQYILVELSMVVFAILIYLTMPQSISLLAVFSYLIYHIVLISILVAIAVYDFKHKIIPDEFSFSFAVLALLGLFFGAGGNLVLPSMWQLLAGPLVALPTLLIYLVSSGRWMGLGDSKLFLGIGWMLGLSLGFSAFILSFWIGAIVSIAILRLPGSSLQMKSQIPFAPFIIAAALLVFFTKIDVLGLSNFFL